jgi:hypothetical protein
MSPERRKAARKKRRSFQQMMEEESGVILRRALPSQWVIHEYTPDYGIDGSVEIFEYVDEEEEYAETLGETFFFQLKSVRSCDVTEVKLLSRRNVEKGPYLETDGDPVESEIIKYQLETDELLTIEAMGSGLVVVLFLVCLDSQRVYFLSLTDAVDKILTPESPDWRDQRSKVIQVPALNELTPTTPLLSVLRFYGARPKLTGMFSKVHFQWAELGHGIRELSEGEWYVMASHFTDALLRLDIWHHPSWVDLLGKYGRGLRKMRRYLDAHAPEEIDRNAVLDFWFRMDAVSRTFEDVAREWGLPTALGQMCSYPSGWLDQNWKPLPPELRSG